MIGWSVGESLGTREAVDHRLALSFRSIPAIVRTADPAEPATLGEPLRCGILLVDARWSVPRERRPHGRAQCATNNGRSAFWNRWRVAPPSTSSVMRE